jgi:tRNA nucleotidyltransferase (CCA-adding enzyme)
MHEPVHRIAEAVAAAGGRALVVGGWVRDRLLGIDSKDVDVEVYGIEPDALKRLLRKLGRVSTVGESFTVYKTFVGGEEVDVSVPRRESKTGRGHRGFTVVGDPSMTIEEAARRRDFTINAIMVDPLTDELIDPFRGAEDLAARRLRVVDPETFVEDSLRVLRAAQFAARFELEIDPATVELCRAIDLSDLPRERVWGEMEKLLLRARRPSLGLAALRVLGVPEKLFPELGALTESDWEAAGRACDAARTALDESDFTRGEKTAVMLAALCRDLTVEATERLFDHLNVHTIGGFDARRRALALVQEAGAPARLYAERERVTDGDVRRLACAAEPRLLAALGEARGDADAASWLLARARALGVERGAPAPLLLGRHVLELGVPAGPEVGQITRAVYELQLDGTVRDLESALAAAKAVIGAFDPDAGGSH